MYCFIDDLHLAKVKNKSCGLVILKFSFQVDNENKQTALEILRQHIDSGYFYDFTNKKWQNVKNVTYIATFNSKVYSPTNSISNKILKHFHIVAQHFPR